MMMPYDDSDCDFINARASLLTHKYGHSRTFIYICMYVVDAVAIRRDKQQQEQDASIFKGE